MSLKVELLAHTTEPVRTVAASAKLCYSDSSAMGLYDGLSPGNAAKFLETLRTIGHLSPFEHASFTFAVDGLSRVASHQLVRHRMASFSQQSQRYVTMGGPRCVMPPSIAANHDAARLYDEQARQAQLTYDKLIAMGVKKEDARFILPHGYETSLVVTMNARELHHFFSVRICKRAQWEIRRLAHDMLVLVYDLAPELFTNVGPSCITEGTCHEAKPCGHPYESFKALLKGNL